MIPIRRPQGIKPTPVTPLPGLTKGMARLSWSKGERDDIQDPGRVPRVPGYAPTIGPPGQLGGILPTPRVPGPGARQGQRERFLAWVKTGRKGQAGTSYDQLLQAVQGGGRPQGPLVQGYISQLARTLLEGM
jgi:hypothetical protein